MNPVAERSGDDARAFQLPARVANDLCTHRNVKGIIVMHETAVRAARQYRIDPAVAHARAVKGGQARHTPDSYIRTLWKRRADLTARQRAALIRIAVSREAEDTPPPEISEAAS